MFAFAVWDERRKTLLLARDRLGIKPLFYTVADGRLAFGSELKVLLQLPEIERKLNWGSVNYLFSSMCTPSVGKHHRRRAQAATRAHSDGFVATRCSGPRSIGMSNSIRITAKPNSISSNGLRDLLEESVRLRLIADVPLGAFLSGGIDSSAVVATMARISSGPVKTFSIGFPDRTTTSWITRARLRANSARTITNWSSSRMCSSIIDDLAWYLDEPFGDSSAIPTYMVSKLAAEHVTVVLVGRWRRRTVRGLRPVR